MSFLASCEKVIDLKYKSNLSSIVIEGNITNEAGPYFVKITKSIPLPETGAYPTLDNAIVTISDNVGNSEALIPQGNGIYHTTSLVGVEGRTYTLIVDLEGKKYTAQSTMPTKVPFDSIKVENILFAGETEYNLIPVYIDPLARGNNYRFVLTLNNKILSQHLVQNDEVRNGVANALSLEITDNDLEIKAGDSIKIQMQCIDKKVSLYYNTLAQVADGGPGGGTTPSTPPSNISNSALGIFSAHTVETKNTTIH